MAANTAKPIEARALADLRCDPRDEALAETYGERVRSGVAAHTMPPPPPRTILRFVPISEFLTQVTAPRWLIRDIVERDSLLLVFGDPESGKSFLVMDWAACVATGHTWNGFEVEKGPVLYINGEGHNGINRRFTAWAIANQVNLVDSPLFVSSTTTALTDEVAREELLAVVSEFMRGHGQPLLIVIDTLARNYGPGDENSTQDMTRAIATCDAIREITGATVAMVHHSGHGDKNRARGAMALRGAVDAEYRLQRVPDSSDTTLQCTKMKDAEKPAPMQFRFASVELGAQDDHGREVTSAVLKRTDYVQPDELPKAKSGRPPGTGKHLRTAIDTLQRLRLQAVRNVTQSGRDPAEARVQVESWRDACLADGMHRNRFAEAMAQLKASGRIRLDYGFVHLAEDE